MAFTDQPLAQSFGVGILVLIPKGVPDQYRGIALLEVIYKLVSAIFNQRISGEIQYHQAVHGFRKGRGTGTAIIEAKLRMQMAKQTTNPLYLVFLDLKKAYDTLDRDQTIHILRVYGIGPNIIHFIQKIWDMDTVVPKQAGFYGKQFRAGQGVRQGDIKSPTIFNIIADAIIRECMEVFCRGDGQCSRLVNILFYAVDGMIAGEDAFEVQHLLDLFTEKFASVGLKMKAEKTEAVIVEGGVVSQPISKEAYNHWNR
jgi:Reverse transcriptase (RNA-dependent DNA polymerase)